MDLLDRVRRTIRRHALVQPDARVVAAVSGGSDSVALAHLLRRLDDQGGPRLVGLAHFNHQLRPAADEDERFCEGVAASLERPLAADREDVRALARHERKSIEYAARTARYAFFERARQHFGADVVALGHTMDDQAETFLLRLIRGAGARGLAAMHPRNGSMIRPLIECRRRELCAWLEASGLGFVHDESNDDASIPRNRVRAEVLPLLKCRFNPRVVDVLADEAELAREEWRWMESEADRWWAAVCSREGEAWRLDGEALTGAPLALLRLVIRRTMTAASGGREVGMRDVERARALLQDGGPPFDAPGQRLERVGPDLVLTGRPAVTRGRPAQRSRSVNLFEYPLSIPGEVAVPAGGYVVSAEMPGSFTDAGVGSVTVDGGVVGGTVVRVRRDRCPGPLTVRNRRPGDWFRPAGFGRRKKLQDFFVDRKVARDRRDLIPIVVNSSNRIVWVAGYALDEEFRVTDGAQAVIILRLRPVAGGPV